MDLFLKAFVPRLPLLAEPHDTAVRLLNGFTEGLAGLVIEVYARTLVILNYAQNPMELEQVIAAAIAFYRANLPWLESGMIKTRHATNEEERLGRLTFGSRLPRRVREEGTHYALNLNLNQDTSLYLDTRLLRRWLKQHCAGLRVLNTFAYTGSLGAACLAGGAIHVLQSDLNRRFLNLGKDTYALNGWPVRRMDFLAEDFFRLTARLRRSGECFDLVLLDPPFFSATQAGRVDLLSGIPALVNKVRPLVRNGGRLVLVNNALYLSGREFLGSIEEFGQEGWLELEQIVPIPPDAAGFYTPGSAALPADPAPFNHPTKIAVLKVRRKG
jgi:23S rRNA (cytosine1962-C5)-methyltransferase